MDFDIDFCLQRSLQQDPSQDRPGAEEHRRESDDAVRGQAVHASSSEEDVPAKPVTRGSPTKPRPSRAGNKTGNTPTPPPTPRDREEASGGAGAYSQSDEVPVLEMCCHERCRREDNEEMLICANEFCKDKESNEPCEVHMSCFLAQTIVKQYTTKTPGTRGPRNSMPFLTQNALCPKCTKALVKNWVLTVEDGQAFSKANEARLKAAGVFFNPK